jgi:RNA polymerase sigma-32 factor
MQSRDRSEQRSGADAQREREEGGPASNDGADVFEAELVDAGELDAANAEVVQDEDTGRDALVRRPIARTRGAGAGPLARYDPLQAYMRDVQRHPLLTPAEEHEAAVKYYEHGDVDAAAKLVTANLRLVVKIAYEYRRAHKHIPDLIQEGSIGLMQAVKKYDPYKGVKLSTYAAWWIRAYILRFILNNARLVKLGTTQAQRKLFFNLRKERARLSAMGIEPTPETIAKRLNVPAEDVVQMERRLSSGDQSLDTPLRNTDEANAPSRMELLVEDSGRVDDALADAQVNSLIGDKIRAFGETLGGKDARIFNSRMLAEEPRTLQELGDEFGVSRERVRQLEKRLQNRLKDYLDSELGEDVIGGN